MKRIFALLAVLMLCSCAPDVNQSKAFQVASDGEISTEDLLLMARSSKSDSIEKLLVALQNQNLITSKVFIYDSLGLEMDEVEPKYPRVVLSILGKSWLSFTGDPQGDFYSKIGYLTYSESQRAFDISSIELREGRFVDDREARFQCTTCHFQDVNARWEEASMYGHETWKGVFGSSKGVISEDSDESAKWQTFLSELDSNPSTYERYRVVGLPNLSNSSPQTELHRFEEGFHKPILQRSARKIMAALQHNNTTYPKSLVEELRASQSDDETHGIVRKYFELSGLRSTALRAGRIDFKSVEPYFKRLGPFLVTEYYIQNSLR